MSRQIQCCLALLALTVVCQSSAAGSKLYPVMVNVFNDAAIPASVLETAKREAGRIFKAAHIEIRWIDCTATSTVPPDGSCRDPHGAHHLNLRIVPRGKKQNEDVFGVAFLGVDGTGIYSDVFYDSVEKLRTQGQINIGALLGHVMAHEIGHLLIGSQAHSPWGLMCAKWYGQELQHIEMGTLFFNAEQVKSIQSKLAMSRKMADAASGN